jgi:hypothetical protein
LEKIMAIEGVPDGWELVRIGTPERGEHYLDGVGGIVESEIEDHPKVSWPIIREVGPVCTWQHGVFADGWIAEDQDGSQIWFAVKPLSEGGSSGCDWNNWNNVEDTAWIFIRDMGQKKSQFVNPPVFRADLPWTERIVEVGPSVEKTRG